MIPAEVLNLLATLGLPGVLLYLLFAERKRADDLESKLIASYEQHEQFVIDRLCADLPKGGERSPVYPPASIPKQ